jgi:hypothetical protein
MKFDIPSALQSLTPGAQWVLRGDDYSGLIWNDTEKIKPSEEEVLAEIQKIKTNYDKIRYQQQRKTEYPPLADLADALYWQSNGDDSKMLAYMQAVQQVKDKYPKGE